MKRVFEPHSGPGEILNHIRSFDSAQDDKAGKTLSVQDDGMGRVQRERPEILPLNNPDELAGTFTPLFWKSGKRNLGLDSKSFINILNCAFGMTDKK